MVNVPPVKLFTILVWRYHTNYNVVNTHNIKNNHKTINGG